MSGIYLTNPHNEFRPDKTNKDWKWLQDKMFQMVNIVNDSVFHFDVDGCDDELKLIEYTKGGFYGWHTDFNAGSCSNRKIVGIVQLQTQVNMRVEMFNLVSKTKIQKSGIQ